MNTQTTAPRPYDRDPPVLRFIKTHIWAIAFVSGMVAITAIRPLLRHVPEPPAVMYSLADFTLTDERGRPFGPKELSGDVWIASFIFTSCPSTCPAVTRAMLELQRRFDEDRVDVKLVSFTVDPETDTVEVLARHAAAVGADSERWRFVTGRLEDVRAAVEEGFRLGVGDKQDAGQGMYDIAHSTKLVLIDRDGGVRGYYGIDADGIDEVFHRSQHVLGAPWKSR